MKYRSKKKTSQKKKIVSGGGGMKKDVRECIEIFLRQYETKGGKKTKDLITHLFSEIGVDGLRKIFMTLLDKSCDDAQKQTRTQMINKIINLDPISAGTALRKLQAIVAGPQEEVEVCAVPDEGNASGAPFNRYPSSDSNNAGAYYTPEKNKQSVFSSTSAPPGPSNNSDTGSGLENVVTAPPQTSAAPAPGFTAVQQPVQPPSPLPSSLPSPLPSSPPPATAQPPLRRKRQPLSVDPLASAAARVVNSPRNNVGNVEMTNAVHTPPPSPKPMNWRPFNPNFEGEELQRGINEKRKSNQAAMTAKKEQNNRAAREERLKEELRVRHHPEFERLRQIQTGTPDEITKKMDEIVNTHMKSWEAQRATQKATQPLRNRENHERKLQELAFERGKAAAMQGRASQQQQSEVEYENRCLIVRTGLVEFFNKVQIDPNYHPIDENIIRSHNHLGSLAETSVRAAATESINKNLTKEQAVNFALDNLTKSLHTHLMKINSDNRTKAASTPQDGIEVYTPYIKLYTGIWNWFQQDPIHNKIPVFYVLRHMVEQHNSTDKYKWITWPGLPHQELENYLSAYLYLANPQKNTVTLNGSVVNWDQSNVDAAIKLWVEKHNIVLQAARIPGFTVAGGRKNKRSKNKKRNQKLLKKKGKKSKK